MSDAVVTVPGLPRDVELFPIAEDLDVWLYTRQPQWEIFFDLVGSLKESFFSLPENRPVGEPCGVPIWGY